MGEKVGGLKWTVDNTEVSFDARKGRIREDFGNRRKSRLCNDLQRSKGCEAPVSEAAELPGASQSFSWNRN